MAIPLMRVRDFWPGFSSPYDTHSLCFSIASLRPNFQKHHSPQVQPTCSHGQPPPRTSRSAPRVPQPWPCSGLHRPPAKKIGSVSRSLFR
jgi:hypothetical protein